MNKPIQPRVDFNHTFSDCQIKITQLGNNKAFDNSEKAKEELKLHPVFFDFEIIKSPLSDQIGRTGRIKLSNTNNIKVGDIITIAPKEKMLSDGIVVWYASNGKRYGHDWLYINASIKGGEIIDWN